jgi:hypothetical protein
MRRLLPLALMSLAAACDGGGREAPSASTEPSTTKEVSAPPAPAPRPPSAAPVLTSEGYGPVRIGMREAQARAVLGPDVRDDTKDSAAAGMDTAACHHIWVGAEPKDVVYMVEAGRVTRITVTGGGVKTGEGLALGATEAAVRAAYGDRLEVEPHAYVEAPAKYLTAWTVPERRGVRYETDFEGLVSGIHAGGPSIRYIEGCS